MKSRILGITLVLTMLISLFPVTVNAEKAEEKYRLGELYNTGKDNGYSERNPIGKDDPHYKWKMGEFFVTGFSDDEKDAEGNFVFLKNVGDKITLWFCLAQDINCLNANEKLTISEDKDGYDEYFGVEKTNFGKGSLIIRKKDSENRWGEPVIYTNYLEAQASLNAYTQVELFEEGDYEIALNYEIQEAPVNILGWKPFPSYYNYRIFFRFSVRNGNCMVYPFDTKTKAELNNAAFTENGFYLDLANSKYLNVNVKREILAEGAEGLIEDTRFNRPAKEGEQFTEEGIYTITVTNEYTHQETEKKIYVGTNAVMKAYVKTGFSIKEINQQLALGATINENGELVSTIIHDESTPATDVITNDSSPNYGKYIILTGALLLGVIVFVVTLAIRKNQKAAKRRREES